MEKKVNVFSELKFVKRFSSETRLVLVGGILVLIIAGAIGGYFYGDKNEAVIQKDSLSSKNYQLKFESLDSKEVTGILSEGLKLVYKGEEFASSDLEITPSKESKTLNLKLTLNNETLSLILPLFVKTEVVSSSDGSQPTSSQNTGKYVASASGGKYHLPDCRYAKKMKSKIWYGSKEEATADGKDPCGVCKP